MVKANGGGGSVISVLLSIHHVASRLQTSES